jgi:hypothetical protein
LFVGIEICFLRGLDVIFIWKWLWLKLAFSFELFKFPHPIKWN